MRMLRTPLGAIAVGLAAGACGTAAMTAVQLAEQRLRGTGGGHPRRWEEAPAPAQVAERVSEGVFQRRLPLERAPFLANAVHWAYGIGWGAAFGIMDRSLRPALPLAAAGFGTGVWASSYAVLPAMGIYEPPWRYPARTLLIDLGRHLVYGAGVAASFRAADRAVSARR
jgi:hypothetical protein